MATDTHQAASFTEATRDAGSLRVPSRAGIVYRKELREIFRDRRTLFAVVLSPLLFTPMMLGILGAVIHKQTSQARVENLRIGLVGAERAPWVERAFRNAPHMRVEKLSADEARQRVQAHQLRAAVILPEDAAALLREGRSVPVELVIDAGSDASRNAAGRLRAFFDRSGQRLVAERLKASGLSPEMAKPFQVTETPIKGGGTAGTLILAVLLPYMLVLSALMGGVYAANDLVAGEKERGTLETLLVTPASRRDLVLGKFMAVASVSLLNSVLSVIGLLLTFYLPLAAFAWLAKDGLKLSPAAVVVLFAVQLPLAVLGASLLLGISTFSRNQKEAQTYLGPTFLLVSLSATLSMFLKAESSWPLALAPILNTALILKQAISNAFDPLFIGIAFTASIVYAALALTFATRLFEKESVLLKA